jgi:hypothetical protein
MLKPPSLSLERLTRSAAARKALGRPGRSEPADNAPRGGDSALVGFDARPYDRAS